MVEADEKAALPRLFTWPVIAVTLVNLFFFSAYLFFFPTLPFFIKELGGRESEIGLLIGISSLTALAVRPIVGYLVDAWGRKPVLLTGLTVFAVNCMLHNVVTGPAGVMPLRLLTGVSLAAVVTAASTYVADMAPPSRRGEAIAYFGLANALGFAIGPALGGFIITTNLLNDFDGFFTSRLTWLSGAHTGQYHFTTLFLVATVISLATMLLVTRMPESRPAGAGTGRRIGWGDLFARVALFPATISFTTSFSFAAMVTFIPLWAREQGLQNPGSIFIVYAAAIIVMRLTIGRRIDRVSRAAVIIPSILATIATLLLTASATNVTMLFIAAGLWGIGAGGFQPAMMAFMVDRTPPEIRGRAMGTFTMGNDLGLGIGSFLLGVVIEVSSFRVAYVVAAFVVAVGLALFVGSLFRRPPGGESPGMPVPGGFPPFPPSSPDVPR